MPHFQPRVAKLLPISVSTTALLASFAALALSFLHNPASASLDEYDLTTPEAALTSNAQMMANNDIVALMGVQNLEASRRARETLESLTVHMEAEWKGKMVLFVSYVNNGVTIFDTPTFEKDAKRGLWISKGTPHISQLDKELGRVEAMMKSWREHGEQ